MTRAERAPGRFTIVLPVRNGGNHVRECVASVLAQSFGDFGLAILENASTDGTAEWAGRLSDPRVRVWSAPRPLSIEENWSRARALPKGEFMFFVGHDDRLDPDYLAVIDALIRREPGAALYTTHFRLIDAAGRVIRRCRPMPARETQAGFLQARLTFRTDMTAMGVVMRSHAHDRIGGIPAFARLAHADDALWLALLEDSCMATAPDMAFSYRWHRASTFGSLPWCPAVTAMEEFARHVEALARERPDVTEVWQAEASRFLARRYRYILLSNTLGSHPGAASLAAREREEILASLARLDLPAAARVRRSRRVRLAAWAMGTRGGPMVSRAWAAYWRLRWRWTGFGSRRPPPAPRDAAERARAPAAR